MFRTAPPTPLLGQRSRANWRHLIEADVLDVLLPHNVTPLQVYEFVGMEYPHHLNIPTADPDHPIYNTRHVHDWVDVARIWSPRFRPDLSQETVCTLCHNIITHRMTHCYLCASGEGVLSPLPGRRNRSGPSRYQAEYSPIDDPEVDAVDSPPHDAYDSDEFLNNL